VSWCLELELILFVPELAGVQLATTGKIEFLLELANRCCAQNKFSALNRRLADNANDKFVVEFFLFKLKKKNWFSATVGLLEGDSFPRPRAIIISETTCDVKCCIEFRVNIYRLDTVTRTRIFTEKEDLVQSRSSPKSFCIDAPRALYWNWFTTYKSPALWRSKYRRRYRT